MLSAEIDPPVDLRPISNFSSLAVKLADWLSQVQQGQECEGKTLRRIGAGYLSPGRIFGLQGTSYFPNPDSLEATWYRTAKAEIDDNDHSTFAGLRRQIAAYMEPHVRKDRDLTFRRSFSLDS